MKKFLLTVAVIFFAYYTAYITSGAYEKQGLFTTGSSPLFYRIYCALTGSTDTTNAESLHLRALSNRSLQNYQLAINDLKKAIQLDSTFSLAYTDLADVYIESGDTSMALKTLNNYLKFADYPDYVYVKLGEIYNLKGLKDSTIYYYTKSLEINKESHDVYYRLAIIFYQDTSYSMALDNINQAISRFESELEYRNLRRLIYLKQNQQLLAEAEYQFIYTNNPSYFGQHEENAKAAYDKGDYRSAIENYKLALIDKPNNRGLLEARAWAYHQLSEYDSSYMDYLLVSELEPDYLSYFNVAYILDIQNKIKESISYYDKSIKLKDDYHITYNNRGYEYFRLKKYKEAEKDYTKSIELKSDYYLSLYNRGNLYANLNKHDKAVVDYLEALKYENSSDINYDLALSYDKLKNKEAAINYFNEYLKLAGESDSVRINYSTKRVAELSSNTN